MAAQGTTIQQDEMTPQTARRRRASDRLPTVTGSTFNALVLQGNGPIVVEFMSYGCAHCRVLEPVLQQVEKTVEASEKIFRVNIAVDQELSDRYQIQGTPTLIMFLNGSEVGRVEGPHPTVASLLAAVTLPFESR